jgi:hypothetical protein
MGRRFSKWVGRVSLILGVFLSLFLLYGPMRENRSILIMLIVAVWVLVFLVKWLSAHK